MGQVDKAETVTPDDGMVFCIHYHGGVPDLTKRAEEMGSECINSGGILLELSQNTFYRPLRKRLVFFYVQTCRDGATDRWRAFGNAG